MTADGSTALRAYVDEMTDAPIRWGLDDCSAIAAEWVWRRRGLRVPLPAYSSRGEAEARHRRGLH